MTQLSADRAATRDQIMGLQSELAKFEQVEFELKHYHAKGIYAREIFVPAGGIVVGKIQKYTHINTISKGRVIVITETGRMDISAPFTFVSEAGAKRCCVVLEDTIWTTYHATEKELLEEIEDELIAPDFGALDAFLKGIEVDCVCHG